MLEVNNEEFTESKNMLENYNPKLNQSLDSTTYKVLKKNQCGGHHLNSHKKQTLHS